VWDDSDDSFWMRYLLDRRHIIIPCRFIKRFPFIIHIHISIINKKSQNNCMSSVSSVCTVESSVAFFRCTLNYPQTLSVLWMSGKSRKYTVTFYTVCYILYWTSLWIFAQICTFYYRIQWNENNVHVLLNYHNSYVELFHCNKYWYSEISLYLQ
jgi:hypothetical protein